MCTSSPHHGRHHGKPRLVMSGLARTYPIARVIAMASITMRPGPAAPVNGSGRFGISCLRTCRLLWREMASRYARCARRRRAEAVILTVPGTCSRNSHLPVQIDVTSRAAPRPTGEPITQRETQRAADGFPIDADYFHGGLLADPANQARRLSVWVPNA